MKKLIIAVFALTGFSVVSFAQSASPPKKNETVKTQPAKNKPGAKTSATNVSPAKATATTQSVHTKPDGKHGSVKQEDKKPAAKSATAKPATAATTGKGGNATVHHKSNNSQAANAATGHLKEDGTPEKDVKEHKKHG